MDAANITIKVLEDVEDLFANITVTNLTDIVDWDTIQRLVEALGFEEIVNVTEI